ncbi:anti-repressor SinI family protein [Lentibacillus jeotgali]|nr:anti-repressor SinI family protein [Lentibacillus jeotgali]
MLRMNENAAIDQEWVELIKEAKRIGLTVDDVRMMLDRNPKTCHSS